MLLNKTHKGSTAWYEEMATNINVNRAVMDLEINPVEMRDWLIDVKWMTIDEIHDMYGGGVDKKLLLIK